MNTRAILYRCVVQGCFEGSIVFHHLYRRLSLYISTSVGYNKWRRFVVKPLEKPTVQVYYALQYTTIKYSTDDYSQSCEIADEVPRSDLVDSYSIRWQYKLIM